MTPINPIDLLILALAASLGILLMLSVSYDVMFFQRRRRKRAKTLYRCGSCGRIYEEPVRTPLARCPGCGEQNEPVRE